MLKEKTLKVGYLCLCAVCLALGLEYEVQDLVFTSVVMGSIVAMS